MGPGRLGGGQKGEQRAGLRRFKAWFKMALKHPPPSVDYHDVKMPVTLEELRVKQTEDLHFPCCSYPE